MAWILGGAGLLAAGAVAFWLMRGRHDETARPAPLTAQPAVLDAAAPAVSPPGVLDAGAAAAPPPATLDAAAPSASPPPVIDAAVPPRDAAAPAGVPKKVHAPPRPATPGAHDSHSIEDPFAK